MERLTIHTLIVADRRRDGGGSAKAAMDREEAAHLSSALVEDRPDDRRHAHVAAMSTGPRWRKYQWNALQGMSKTRTIPESLAARTAH
jgi:hypothetical protein